VAERGLIFANHVDFDMLYGHRNDAGGYAAALESFDRDLGALLPSLGRRDLLIISADHGCDPGFPGTDHTREYVPLLAYRPGHLGRSLGTRATFSDVGATVLEAFGLTSAGPGRSFLSELSSAGD
jgi:phosphopentomutase